VPGLKILLVGYFYTSGSVTEACAKALRKFGATDVGTFTLANAWIAADTDEFELEMELAGRGCFLSRKRSPAARELNASEITGSPRKIQKRTKTPHRLIIFCATNHQNTNGRKVLRGVNERKNT
jgi:hypothetical protein